MTQIFDKYLYVMCDGFLYKFYKGSILEDENDTENLKVLDEEYRCHYFFRKNIEYVRAIITTTIIEDLEW